MFCIRCNYISSQTVCKACVLLEGLNKGKPKLGIGKSSRLKERMENSPDDLVGSESLEKLNLKEKSLDKEEKLAYSNEVIKSNKIKNLDLRY